MTGAIECRYYGRDFTADEMALLRALTRFIRAPWKGAVTQRVRTPPGNCRSSR